MQAIIRFSLDGDQNGALWNRLNTSLNQSGFTRSGNTATYRHGNISAAGVQQAMSAFWNAIATNLGPCQIDHFWMYSNEHMFPADLGVATAPQAAPEND